MTTGPTTDNIVWNNSRKGTIKVVLKLRQLWIRGYQPTQPTIELLLYKTMLFKVVIITSELSVLEAGRGGGGDFENSTFHVFTTQTLETI